MPSAPVGPVRPFQFRQFLPDGSTQLVFFVMSSSASISTSFRPSFTWSSAVLTVVASRPEGSVYVVLVMPSSLAVSFIFLTNASWEPESQRASSRAMLLADGIMRAAIASYSEIFSPSLTVSRVDSLSVELFFLPSVSAVLSTSIIAPCSPFFMGWSRRMMYAVIDLVTLAIGTGFCSPDWPSVPRPAAAM